MRICATDRSLSSSILSVHFYEGLNAVSPINVLLAGQEVDLKMKISQQHCSVKVEGQ